MDKTEHSLKLGANAEMLNNNNQIYENQIILFFIFIVDSIF